MITLNDLVIDQWKDKLDAAIEASRQKGLWELVETRWCPYMKSSKEKAMVPILKITKGNIQPAMYHFVYSVSSKLVKGTGLSLVTIQNNCYDKNLLGNEQWRENLLGNEQWRAVDS